MTSSGTGGDTPIPQANSISVITSVVDAVAAGADTSPIISQVIGMAHSQGQYYPNAAATLGYLDRVDGKWYLTDAGRELELSDQEARAADVRTRLLDNVDVQALIDDPGGDALRFRFRELSDTTIERRISTIRTWLLDSSKPDAAMNVGRASAVACENAPSVVAAYHAALEAKALRAPKTCPLCQEIISVELGGECSCPNAVYNREFRATLAGAA